MGAKYNYEFSVDINNHDNDDSGVVFRFQDKNNFIRFHTTRDNEYNQLTTGGIQGGCTGKGSFLVVRKNGKEYCAGKSNWMYTQNRYHSFKVRTTADGSIDIWVDRKLLMHLRVSNEACARPQFV